MENVDFCYQKNFFAKVKSLLASEAKRFNALLFSRSICRQELFLSHFCKPEYQETPFPCSPVSVSGSALPLLGRALLRECSGTPHDFAIVNSAL